MILKNKKKPPDRSLRRKKKIYTKEFQAMMTKDSVSSAIKSFKDNLFSESSQNHWIKRF